MVGIQRFEDIVAWQGARALVKEVYGVTADGSFARDHSLRDQVQRAAVSIVCNIAEGFERGTNKEFRQFLYVAKASAGEVRALLYLALDLGYIDEVTHRQLADRVLTLGRQMSGFIRYLDTVSQSNRQSHRR